ncbi:MAG: site-2 protease family protein [Isosphaeraceae bacterium]
METLIEIKYWLMVVLGLGFVIFIHELGHFLVAKWNGVKVLKFSLGFGPALISYRKGMGVRFGSSAKAYADWLHAEQEKGDAGDVNARGETEYAIRALPLGGAVHMLGEGEGESVSESAGEEGSGHSNDPRAYNNRPVGARMAIISAGVIMNLLLGWACFATEFLRPRKELSAKVGYVVAGAPAYDAGIRPGDEIVAVDGQANPTFSDILRTVVLSASGQVVRLDLKRAGQGEVVHLPITPKRTATADHPTIGVGPADSLILYPEKAKPFLALPGMTDQPTGAILRGDDKVVAIGPHGETPEPVADIEAVHRLLVKYRKVPVDVVVERTLAGKNGQSAIIGQAVATIPPNHFVDFGFQLKIGPVQAVQPDSPASKAGFEVGDLIVKVDGHDFDPLRLPTDLYDRAGEPVKFEVSRPSPGGATRTLTLTATPNETPPWVDPMREDEPLDVAGLGLAYAVRPIIHTVAEGSPAAKAGLRPGQTIRTLTLSVPGDQDKGKDKGQGKRAEPTTETIPLDTSETAWVAAFAGLQKTPKVEVMLTIGDSESPIRLDPLVVADWYHPARGLRFQPLITTLPPEAMLSAIGRGGKKTIDTVKMVYATIRGLVQQRLGRKAVGGPIRIFAEARKWAESGWEFISFLGLLSVNLAVINFLPIFPLDGGQMLFLIAEKVRGRALPDRIHFPLMVAGLLFVVFLMLFASVNDIRGLIWPP